MTSDLNEPWLVTPAHRAFGWVAFTGLILYAPTIALFAIFGPPLPTWFWGPLAAGLGLAVGTLGVRARRARPIVGPTRAIVLLVLLASVGLFFLDIPPSPLEPWVVALQIVVVALSVLAWRVRWALAIGAVLCLVNAWWQYLHGQPPFTPGAAVVTGLMMFAIVVAAGLASAGFQRSLRGHARAGREAWESVYSAEAAATDLHMRSYWSAVVHDHVLAVLTAVQHLPPAGADAQVRRAAGLALERLTQPPVTLSATVGEVVGWLDRVCDLLPAQIVVRPRLTNPDQQVSGPVAAALLAATTEAARNIVRHARPAAGQIYVWQGDHQLQVIVLDRGPGFVPHEVAPSRLGLRVAVEQRMSAVGGIGTWRSQPGKGTAVVLTWPAPGSP
ncbi:MAG: sensor histidine kinase [Actinomycetales bacterium]